MRCVSHHQPGAGKSKTVIHAAHTQDFGRRRPMESNESSSPAASRQSGSSTGTMKILLCEITVFMIVQLAGIIIFGFYFHMKLDKVGDEISWREDFVFLRRLQKCRTSPKDDTTLLDCKKILNQFQDLTTMSKLPEESRVNMLKGEKKPSATIHLAGFKNSSKPVSVLAWKKAGYAPKDDMFFYQGGKVTVARGGRYYIYTQVTFCTKPGPLTPFSVFVYLNLPTESDQLLLKGVGTHSPSDNMCGLQSIHLGRVVDLRDSHILFVNVTNSSRVNYDNGNTYFGMFEIS